LIATTAVTPAIQAYAADNAPGAKGRVVLPFNRRWRYSAAATPAAHEREFDDSSFARITLPHANVRLPWHSFDDKSYEFVSIYRRRFRMPGGARSRRIFVDFEGAMTAATVWLNGVRLGEHKGGYTPFSFELGEHIDWDGDNVLAVEADSTERADIPPFGGEIDYLTFGGIYREVHLRLVSQTFIENVFAQPKEVLSANPTLDVDCFLERAQQAAAGELRLEATLYDGNRQLAATARDLQTTDGDGGKPVKLHLDNLGAD
jgi:beta-galactosidase